MFDPEEPVMCPIALGEQGHNVSITSFRVQRLQRGPSFSAVADVSKTRQGAERSSALSSERSFLEVEGASSRAPRMPSAIQIALLQERLLCVGHRCGIGAVNAFPGLPMTCIRSNLQITLSCGLLMRRRQGDGS